MSPSSRFESSPFEPMPVEILDKISALLDAESIKQLRLVTPKVNEGACKLLFSTITIQPLSESADQLEQIIDHGLHKHVQQVRFDLSILWLTYLQATRMHPDELHKKINRLSLTDRSYAKVTELGSSHFGMSKFLEAFGQLTKVDKIVVTSADGSSPYLEPARFDLTVIFFQILRLARRLPRPVKIFSVATRNGRSLTDALFDPNLPPHTIPWSKPISTAIALQEVSNCFQLWRGIEKFEVKLHPQRRPPRPRGPSSMAHHPVVVHLSALKNALQLMSPSLRQLSITIVRDLKRVMVIGSPFERQESTDDILQGLRLEKLRELAFVNVGEPGPGLGAFISRHLGTLQSFKLAYPAGMHWVLSYESLQALRDVLGDDLSILTLACCGSLNGRNCGAPECKDGPCRQGHEYEIRADKLAKMVLDDDLNSDAVYEALGVPILHRPEGDTLGADGQ